MPEAAARGDAPALGAAGRHRPLCRLQAITSWPLNGIGGAQIAAQCSASSGGEGHAASEHRQVVARLGAGLECPTAGAAGRQAGQEATSPLAQARPPSGG